jgi:stress response protein YsnF
LRDEHVKVDRKRVDRPVTESDRLAMKDQTIEMTERHEEPVIEKRARVKEEVTLSKEQTERVERVDDTVKTTDVKLDKIGTDDATKRQR